MAMAQKLENDFDIWLNDRLTFFDADGEVMGPYIKGILETDEFDEDVREELEGILSGVIEGDFTEFCEEILGKWLKCKHEKEIEDAKPKVMINVDEKLSQLLKENKMMAPVVTHTISKEQRKLKEAILSQYSQVSDGEESCSEDDGELSTQRNTNAEDVKREEREKRDKDKADHQMKKDKDKEDRAKQKLKEDERKEKEKKRTQKVEKRR